MMREYNSQAFTPDQVEKGDLTKLLNYLTDFNSTSSESYMDIHICSDGYCTIVEWTEVNFDNIYDYGKFKYVPYDGHIFREYTFPDNHVEYFESDEEFEEALREWLEKNPGWKKTLFGAWTNEIENEHFRRMLAGEELEQEDEPQVTLDEGKE